MLSSRQLVLPALALCLLSLPVRADEKAVNAVLDKAIKAMGGEEKLTKAANHLLKSKGSLSINGEESPVSSTTTYAGLDKLRAEFEVTFGGNEIKGVSILNGDKGWRKVGDMSTEIEGDMLSNEKRTVYLHQIPTTILPLRSKGFKVESAEDAKAGDKPAAVLKVIAPDGKDFQLFFDKESGLPVKLVAKVAGFGGDEVDQETIMSEYKDFDGVKKATKLESKRDGQPFLKSEVTEFKVLDKVDDKKFAEPE